MLGTLYFDQHVYIYGAGFAGLSLAYKLKKLGTPFTLYEKEKVGGKISTKMTEYGPVESAASTLYMNAKAEKFIQELELPYLDAQKKLKRWIYKEDGIVSPFSMHLLTQLILKMGKRFPKVTENSTVEDIFLPLLGRKYIEELLSPALQGIYGAEARDLHFLSLFPFSQTSEFVSYYSFLKFFKSEIKKDAAQKIKGSISFKGGMQTLINRLHEEVKDHIEPLPDNFILRPNTAICTSAPDAASLIEEFEPELAKLLNEIEYRPMTTLSFFMEEEIPELNKSFGMLIPQKYGGPILGIIHQSEVFPSNYSAHCYAVVCKGIVTKEEIYKELKLKFPHLELSNILEHSLTAWGTGLPLYNEKRFKAINQIKHVLKERTGIVLFGNYTDGISLRSMIEQTSLLK